MKTLLTLFDNPSISKEFVRYAIYLAKNLNATVQLVFVQNPQVIPLVAPGTGSTADVHIHEDIEALARSVKNSVVEIIRDVKEQISAEIKVEYKSETGSASLIIEEMTSNGEVDMVLLEGEPDKPFWLQTNSNLELIENASCPVLVVAPNTEYQPLKKIIYATDYREEDIKTLKELIELTRPFVTDILALHISESMDFEEKVKKVGFNEMLKAKTNFNNISLKVLIDKNERDVVEVMNEEIDKEKANLVVILKENRSFFERLFKSSFTADVIKNVDLPVLVFHSKQ
jgi:nucleotide-binding universal stress UspA family protein